MGRAPCCDKANVKKGPWSPEEDAKLKAYIEQYGTGGNWIALPQKIGLKRCGKSCRLRWLNYLRPNIKHGGFSEEEDNIICSLYISIGSRWSIIAAQLPGRTDNDIKNYWNTRLKKKLLGRRKNTNRVADPKNGVEDNNQYSNSLSNSALERLQLHMHLQSLQNPFSVYGNNAALWHSGHPLQAKMIETVRSSLNENPNLLRQHVPQDDRKSINPLDSDDIFSNAGKQPVSDFQYEIEEFFNNNNTSPGLQQQNDHDHMAELDCINEMDDPKHGLLWLASEFNLKSGSSSNSWADSYSVFQSEGMFQDYVHLGYNM